MYVRPAGRGAGLGRGLLLAVEESATRLGAARIVCETNTQPTEHELCTSGTATRRLRHTKGMAGRITGTPRYSAEGQEIEIQ
ncbi:hypothetical protein OG813_08515 [Streptomyces sp. NBC_00081]